LYGAISNIYRIISGDQHLEPVVAKYLSDLIGVLTTGTAARESESQRERTAVGAIMEGFTIEDSTAWRNIKAQYGDNLSHQGLLKIANDLRLLCGAALTPLKRIHRRRKAVLIRWFEDNWEVIGPRLATVAVPIETEVDFEWSMDGFPDSS
jgi:hypothetical protein